MNKLPLILCASALLAPALAAQDLVTVFEGPPAGVGALVVYEAASGLPLAAPTQFSGLRLLPLDCTARTALTEFSPRRARHFADIAGAARVRLPDDRGSVYHFVRPSAGLAASFGYIHVSHQGAPRLLIERPGIGVGGGRNPFLTHVAVAPDGRAILVATQGEGGGDLLEIATDATLTIHDHTALLPPARIFPWSLMLGDSFGAAVTNSGVLRFDRSGASGAAFVPFGADVPPTYFSGNLVASDNTAHIAFTAGTSATALHVWSAAAVGDARRASATAGIVSRAGDAADGADGPWLAVSDDGNWCAWRTTMTSATLQETHECLVARAESAPAPAEQLSSDARFLDTLDEVALFAFRGPGRLIFGVGEQNPGGLPDKLDLFAAHLQPGVTPQLQNLTVTSGDATVPFLSVPALKPSRVAFLPDGSGIVLHDDSGSSGDVAVWRDGQPGLQVVLPLVKDLDDLTISGPGALFAVRRDNGARELYRIASDFMTPPIFVASAPSTTFFEQFVARDDGLVGFIERDLSGERLSYVHTLQGSGATLVGGPAAFGAARAWTASGKLLSTRIQNGVHAHLAWLPGSAPVRMQSTSPVGQILPGN